MSEPIIKFLQAARSAGIRVSVAESIDAYHALDLIGFDDRQTLKDSLSLILAKTRDEKQLFEECFELYFTRDSFTGDTADSAGDGRRERQPEEGDAGGEASGSGGAEGQTPLARMLTGNDRAALAAAMERAADAVGVSDIRFFTQTNIYARRMMEQMGLEALEREIARLRAEGTTEAVGLAQRLDRGRGYLGDQVRDFVERQLAVFARGANEQLRDEFLQAARLSNLDRRDFERMRVIVRAMAKRLATRYGRVRRRRRRGHLDVRRTLRRNMAFDSIPFVTVWKQRKIDKPRVVVLCDVSGSVASVAQFLLLFVYSLNEALADIRSFAFSGNLIEVSDIVEQETIEDAIAKILKEIGFGSSNYGRSLADFAEKCLDAVDSKTTVIVMGDARGNNTDPRTDIMKLVFERSKRVIWLNPEFRSSWGTGDSDMYRYAPYCHVLTVCNSVRHLERTLTDLLKGSNV
ncbi:MAG TPA: VWA domain-containing protein [Candidatus Sulfotelmatobacter sp.]|nr:VWA domain-containing protein [Candidatus Sulfotelmatobacter sp.]